MCFLPMWLISAPPPTPPAQTAPPPAVNASTARTPGVGDLLPPFSYRSDHAEGSDRAGKQVVHLIGHVVFTIGDLSLQADDAVFDKDAFTLEATGHVVFTRGDEVLRGSHFFMASDEGTLRVDDGEVVSPPFFIAGKTITQKPGEIHALNARLVPDPEGKGELQFRASDVLLRGDGRTTLTNATVFVLGLRLLTLKKIVIEPTKGDNGGGGLLGGGGSNGGAPSLPISLRASGISGTAFGVNVPFGLPFHISAKAGAERTTKQGNNYMLSLHRVLVAPQTNTSSRSLLPTPGGIDQSVANQSQLRQLLKARPTPTPPDPILDYESVLFTGEPLTNPTRRGSRSVALDFAYSTNREIGTRRQGPLLLSRQPELVVSAEVPLAKPFERDANNAEQLAYLKRRLRFVASLEGGTGKYDETRLPTIFVPVQNNVSRSRQYLLFGIGTLPYLLGQRFLVSAETDQWISQYGSGSPYHYNESTLAGAYVFGVRQSIGASFIGRTVGGKSPFYFDQVDTQSEARIRFQSPLPFAHGRYTLGLLGRYDLTQNKFFDTEIALAIKGRVLEPRFSYKTLNAQFGFTVAVPGFSSPAYPARKPAVPLPPNPKD